MDIKKTLISTVFIALGLAITAPSALAATPEGDYQKLPATATFSSGKSTLSLADGTTISCESGTGTGSSLAGSKTTAEAAYILHGCKEEATIFKFKCTSEGQPTGTIKLATVVTHAVYLDEAHTRPGVLATPPASGVWAKFTCAGGFSTVEVKGNGILGEVTSPKCGATSSTGTGKTETKSHGVQTVQQVEETGTSYHLEASLGGGAFQSAGTAWSVTGTANQKVTFTCPEQK
jgi:hypothetical protein